VRRLPRVERRGLVEVPWILPPVRHGDDFGILHVESDPIADRMPAIDLGIDAMLLQPRVDIEAIVLLCLQHAGERLAHHVSGILTD
jgi:hypothetical protein